jgi:uncharacterized integral membrane protein
MNRNDDPLATVLWAYPKRYREQRGNEILSTIREDSDRNLVETVRVCCNVIAHGLRLRFGIASDQPTGRVLAAAALPGMMMAAAIAVVLPLYAQLLPGIHHSGASFGPDTAIWPGIFILWILGSLSTLILPRHKQLAAAVCIVVSLVAFFALPVGTLGLPPALPLLIALAIPSLFAPRTWPTQSHRAFALIVGVLTVAILVAASLHNPWETRGLFFYGQFEQLAGYVAVAAVVGGLVLFAARRLVLGTALAVLSVPWLLAPTLTTGPFQNSTTSSTLSIAVGCALGVTLLGAWCSVVLWGRRQLAS